MHGSTRLDGPAEVRAVWAGYAAAAIERDGGFVNRYPAGELEDRTGEAPIAPHVSDGRWCADCPACAGGMACSPEMPDACCFDCGRVWAIDWPPARVLAAGVELLEQRPDERNRHWRPLDESPIELRREAIAHGAWNGTVNETADELVERELGRWREKVAR